MSYSNALSLANITRQRQSFATVYLGDNCIACLVDTKKAFDTVNRECLWYKLLKLGIKGKIYHTVESLYNNVRCAVKVSDVITPFLNVNLGVKQGCRLSPTLFALYAI